MSLRVHSLRTPPQISKGCLAPLVLVTAWSARCWVSGRVLWLIRLWRGPRRRWLCRLSGSAGSQVLSALRLCWLSGSVGSLALSTPGCDDLQRAAPELVLPGSWRKQHAPEPVLAGYWLLGNGVYGLRTIPGNGGSGCWRTPPADDFCENSLTTWATHLRPQLAVRVLWTKSW